MTICIGAISDNNSIVAIADKMVTLTGGVVSTYEINENQKIIELGNNTVAMFAGNVLYANNLLSDIKPSITETDTVRMIADKIASAYQSQLKHLINSDVLSRFGIDIETFMQQQAAYDNAFINSTVELISSADLGVEIIVAGVDPKGPQLFRIYNPGTVEDYNSVGYVSIGSGHGHATLSMVESEYQKNAPKENALLAVVKAKKKAEYDPGVGEMSTIVVIGDTVEMYTDEKTKRIWQEFEKALEKANAEYEKSYTILRGINDGTIT